MGKKTLIVVDMLNDFCKEGGVLARSPITNTIYAEPIIPAVKSVVNAFRKVDAPIIWICDAHVENDLEFERFPEHAIDGTDGAKIIDELNFVDNGKEILIKKTRYSGFYNTELDYHLKKLGNKDVMVVGVCTSICVMDTVGGLANRDYNVIVPPEAVADFNPAAHEAAMTRMVNLYGVNTDYKAIW